MFRLFARDKRNILNHLRMLGRFATNPTLRAVARRTGLIWLIKKLRPAGVDYEEYFAQELLGAIRPGDCVWDIGANIGYYTHKISLLAGDAGQVQAFEPFAATFARLKDSLRESGSRNVIAHQVALGRNDEVVTVAASDEGDGVTNSLVGSLAAVGRTETVRVVRGDQLVAGGVPVPNVLKVDVEAFEEEVLDGLAQTLRRSECRAVFCEVHFSRLEKRGQRNAPRRIEQKLQAAGFSVEWLDASHIGARRTADHAEHSD